MDSLSSSSFLSLIQHQTKVPNALIQYSSSLPQICIMSPLKLGDIPYKATLDSPLKPPKVTKSSSSPPLDVENPPRPRGTPLPTKNVSIRRCKTQATPPKPSKFVSMFLNTIDDIINTFIDPPKRPSVDPRFVLSGNFAPVEELPPTKCEIEKGNLPPCLDGAYIRNGSNPQFPPPGPYHLFDGDGMLHSIRIYDGKAILCSRYVKTYKYIIEHEVGCSIFPNLFSGFNGLIATIARGLLTLARIKAGQFHLSNGIGSANTSLVFFGNKLYALCEADLPYEVKLTPNGNIETVGKCDFNGKLRITMTAHPKVDPTSGEAFAFRYGLVPPYLTYFRFDSKGNKQEDVPIFSMLSPSMLHDFAITKKYAIFPEIQIKMDLAKMITRGRSFADFDPTKVSRIGVIPKYAKNDKGMKWFEVPGFNMLHAINAWDEIDKDGNEAIVMLAPNIISAEHMLQNMHLVHASIEMIKIDLKTKVVSRQPISARNLDMGVINPNYMGKKNKYVYAAVGHPTPKIKGVVKLDVSLAKDRRECVVASRMFGPGCYGGEPFFVATHPDDLDADEDDGYLVLYVHDENTHESRFLVLDATSPDLDVVASVKLPQRVPYGFHGLFVREKDLNLIKGCNKTGQNL